MKNTKALSLHTQLAHTCIHVLDTKTQKMNYVKIYDGLPFLVTIAISWWYTGIAWRGVFRIRIGEGRGMNCGWLPHGPWLGTTRKPHGRCTACSWNGKKTMAATVACAWSDLPPPSPQVQSPPCIRPPPVCLSCKVVSRGHLSHSASPCPHPMSTPMLECYLWTSALLLSP